MRPLKLIIQAFGSYGKKTTIDFQKPNQNLFLITGDTGAGKTTIFDALVFALYGEASSVVNKKDGTELQSQFTGPEVMPYVELLFSERMGEQVEIYTVRRVPRHFRPLKRGKGLKEESASVTLLMPDGTEYPQKEADRKLEEIVGLTKSQFMQVAMIAQGEFMELLRARTEEKKVIFRKLFHTGLYQKIVEELGMRRKEKLQLLEKLRTVCQTEAAHIVVPEEYTEAATLLEQKNAILEGDRFSISRMEELLRELKQLSETCAAWSCKAEKKWKQAEQHYLECRDAKNRGEELLLRFAELESAEREMQECADVASEMRQRSILGRRIRDAWEIRDIWQRYQDSARYTNQAEQKLAECENELPELVRMWEEAQKDEQQKKEELDRLNGQFAAVSERVERSFEMFRAIEQAEAEELRRTEEVDRLSRTAEQSIQKMEELEKEEQEKRKLEKSLIQAEVQSVQWQSARLQAEEVGGMVSLVRQLELAAKEWDKKMEEERKRFRKISSQYERKQNEAEEARGIFLSIQAGILAKEQLFPGRPCPVCGSTDHPDPCQLSKENKRVTREAVDRLNYEASELRNAQEQASVSCMEVNVRLEEQLKKRKEAWERLREKLMSVFPDEADQIASAEQAEIYVQTWRESLQEEGNRLREDQKRLEQVRKFLADVAEEKERLKSVSEHAQEQAVQAKQNLTGIKASLTELRHACLYTDREQASQALRHAKEILERGQEAYREAQKEERKARTARDNADSLIKRYRAELPELKEECAQRKADLDEIRERKTLSEDVWKPLTEQYRREDAEWFLENVEQYNRRKAAVEKLKETAKAAVSGKEKPVPEELENLLVQAKEEMDRTQKEARRLEEMLRVNREVEKKLAPVLEEQGKLLEEQSRLDGLYNLLAGKVTGARMDLETYVQRYYLERILYAANRRFREMSAGQFELRMCSVERAGEGKNRGLDLMVYSAVTGKEREVRTLSGGESFMAALSLALGMADQIQEKSAGVSLDIMFIDEGFGSLDEHARENAIRVLKHMADGSRLIGMISHVTELKQEMENQLIVTKDEEGSHVRWQIS